MSKRRPPSRGKLGSFNRRRFLEGSAAAAAGAAIGSAAITGFPMVWAQTLKNVTLRQFGTGTSNHTRLPLASGEDRQAAWSRQERPSDRLNVRSNGLDVQPSQLNG